jgi:hypothetical protein
MLVGTVIHIHLVRSIVLEDITPKGFYGTECRLLSVVFLATEFEWWAT